LSNTTGHQLKLITATIFAAQRFIQAQCDFASIVASIQAKLGKSRRAALKDMSNRLDVPDVTSFIGGHSVDLMHQYHRELAERLPNWHYFLVGGTDHSLPFQKPRQIARIMEQELVRYLA